MHNKEWHFLTWFHSFFVCTFHLNVKCKKNKKAYKGKWAQSENKATMSGLQQSLGEKNKGQT